MISEDEMRQIIRAGIAASGKSMTKWAVDNRMHAGDVSDVLRGKRPVTTNYATKFGYRAVRAFVKVEPGKPASVTIEDFDALIEQFREKMTDAGRAEITRRRADPRMLTDEAFLRNEISYWRDQWARAQALPERPA